MAKKSLSIRSKQRDHGGLSSPRRSDSRGGSGIPRSTIFLGVLVVLLSVALGVVMMTGTSSSDLRANFSLGGKEPRTRHTSLMPVQELVKQTLEDKVTPAIDRARTLRLVVDRYANDNVALEHLYRAILTITDLHINRPKTVTEAEMQYFAMSNLVKVKPNPEFLWLFGDILFRRGDSEMLVEVMNQASREFLEAYRRTNDISNMIWAARAIIRAGTDYIKAEKMTLDACKLVTTGQWETWCAGATKLFEFHRENYDVIRKWEEMGGPPKEVLDTLPTYTEIQRKSMPSFEEFWKDHALARVPLIITDYRPRITPFQWDFETIRKYCGKSVVELYRRPSRAEPNVHSWGSFVTDIEIKKSIAEFLDIFRQRPDFYLFDQSTYTLCPGLLDDFKVPKYFAQNYILRLPRDINFNRAAQPGLFLGSKGSVTGLHVDGRGTNFWMILFQGRKKWVIYPGPMNVTAKLLYRNFVQATFFLDPSGGKQIDEARFPLYRYAKPVEFIQHPGELVFIPGGTPHYVENLDDTLAVSVNYQDESCIDALEIEMRYRRLWVLVNEGSNLWNIEYEFLHNPNSNKKMNMDPEDTPFQQYLFQ